MLDDMLLALAHLSSLLAGPQEAAESADPVARARRLLESAVDLPTPEQRAARVEELLKLDGLEFEHWRAAAQSFGRFAALEPGVHVDRVPLWVAGREEETELHWFVPSSYDPATPTPLIVGLHGAGGYGANEIAAFQRLAEAEGWLILGPSEAGPNGGYAFSERERQATLAALRWLRRRANVDENCIHLTGVSRGGHACFDLARHPTPWASVVPRIGGPALSLPEGRNNIRLGVNFAHLPLVILQGAGDQDKMLLNQELLLERLVREHADAQRILFEEHGHSYDHQAFDWASFYGKAVREPLAPRLILATARDGEGRSLWLEIDRFSREVKEDFRPRVDPNQWNRWDHTEKARFLQKETDERTARVVAEYHGAGRFSFTPHEVTRLRLWLPGAMLGEGGEVEAEWKGRTRRKKLKPETEVLLRHFVEHFDRSFLPVAVWELR